MTNRTMNKKLIITDEEIIVSKDKVATVKRWLDS